MALAGWLKQSTSVTLKIGPFVDEDDGKTAETALTISQADVVLSKNGGAFAQKNESTSCTHDTKGYYGCPIDTTDTNTLGLLIVAVHESGALPVRHDYLVVPANIFDSYFSTDLIQVDVAQWLGTAAATPTVAGVPEVDVTHWIGTAAATPTTAGVPEVDITHIAGSAVSTSSAQLGVNVVNAGGTAWASGSLTSGVFASGAITAGAIAADAIGASELAADAVAEIADGVWDEARSGHVAAGSFGEYVPANVTYFGGSAGSFTSGRPDVNMTYIAGSIVSTSSAQLGVNVVNAAGTGWASGSLTSGVFASGAITADAIAASAIGASELAADAANEIADALLDRSAGVETGYTPRQALRLIMAAELGKLSGAATTTVTIRDVNDSANRIVATVDSSGNRTAVTLNAS